MKILVTNYTFDASAKTVTFTDINPIVLESVLLITNVTDNIFIYNFAEPTLGGSVSTNVLTLVYDTTSMDDGDDLQIFYEDNSAVQPISAASLPLPTGAAIAANQQTDALTDTQLRATPVPVSGTVTVDTSLLATSAKQDTGNTSLASIDGKIIAVNTGAVVVSSSALPSGAATSANQQTDALTDTELRATPVPVSGTVTVDTSLLATAAKQDDQTALLTTIDGDTSNLDVALSTRTKPSDQQHTIVDSGTLTAVTAITNALPAGNNAIGKLAANSGVDIGDVDVTSVSGNVTVIQGTATNLKTQSEQYVGGTAVSNSNPVPISDAGGSITIDGTVTANAGTNLNTSLLALASTQTDKSQFTKLTDGTDTALITASGEQNVIATAQPGVDIGDVTINNGSGASAVNIQDGGNSITVDYATTGSGTATGALRVELPTNGTGVIATVGAVTAISNALPAGTNAIGKLAANSGVDIGDVDVTSVNSFVAHDSPIAGNPLIIAGVASAAAPTSVSADQDAVRAWYLRNGAAATVLTAAGALIGGDAANGLDVDVTRMSALVAGSAIIGKVGIDQTTPGTTNLVALTAETTKAIGVVRNSDGSGNLLTSNSSTYTAKIALDINVLGTLGTAFSSAGKVDVKSTQKPSIGSTTVMTVTNLQSKANSATVGWQSARVSNLSTLATDYEIFVKLTTANTAPANDKAAYVWLCPWYTSDGGSTWFAASGGTTTLPSGSEGSYTIATPHNFRLLGVLNYTTQQMVMQDVFLLSNAFGNRPPDGFSIIIINYTGAALSTSCIVDYTPLNDALV